MDRIKLLWDNPNQTGAFLAWTLACMWALDVVTMKGRAWPLVLRSLQSATWILLVLTGSRAAILGALVSLGIKEFIQRRLSQSSQAQYSWWNPASQLALVSVVSFLSGVWHRFSNVASDLSGINRLRVWSGSLRLILGAPWGGWGLGSSGAAYHQLVQPPLDQEYYANLVNSYLTTAVDLGLPTLAGIILIGTLSLLASFQVLVDSNATIARRFLSHLNILGITALTIASFFSALWYYPSIIALPALIAGTQLGSLNRAEISRFLLCKGLISAASATVAISALVAASLIAESMAGLSIRRQPGGDVLIYKKGASQGKVLGVAADNISLGAFPGRAIRETLDATGNPFSRVIFYESDSGDLPMKCDILIISGNRASSIVTRAQPESVTFVLPVTPKKEHVIQVSGKIKVYLSAADPYKINYTWINSAVEDVHLFPWVIYDAQVEIGDIIRDLLK